LNYVKVTTRTTLTMTQRVAQGYVTGDLFEMPAGPFSAVLGAEWRAFDYVFDPGANAGPISGFGASDPEAGRNAFHDLFTEIAIPLAKDAPFAKTLDLTLGYRWSRSQFTDDLTHFSAPKADSNTYKAELSWQPVDTWRFRTSYNRSVRAPNFSELFAGGTSFPQIFDPCSITGKKRNGADAAAMATLCGDTGVSGVGTFVATPGSQAEIDLAGNPLLKPETADTYTLGAVFTSNAESQWLTRLRGTVDFYKIKVKDAILTPDPNESIADCYNYYGHNPTYSATANPYCNGMARGPDIQFIGDYQNDPEGGVFAGLNKGTIDTSGVDLQLDWGFDLEWIGAPASLGAVTTNLLFSRLLKYDLSDTPGVGTIDYAGTVNYFGGGIGLAQTLPKWRAFWNTNWTFGDFSLGARARYIDKMENRMAKQFPGEVFKGVGSVTYWDFSAAWRFMEKSEFRLGVNNALNKQPPTYDPNVQSGTDPSTYDVIGRRIFARVEVQF
jgi:outer membrane receptor protein involved in Fe transport